MPPEGQSFPCEHCSWGVGFVPQTRLSGKAAQSQAANRWMDPAGNLYYF